MTDAETLRRDMIALYYAAMRAFDSTARVGSGEGAERARRRAKLAKELALTWERGSRIR